MVLNHLPVATSLLHLYCMGLKPHGPYTNKNMSINVFCYTKINSKCKKDMRMAIAERYRATGSPEKIV